MRNQFPLFQTPIDLAHDYWKKIVKQNDIVIDATCGNGHDTLVLAQLASEGILYAFDIQEEAIEATKSLLEKNLLLENSSKIHLLKQCHSQFPLEIRPATVKLIVYNLGYLPGGNKSNTTRTETTLVSLEKAKELIKPGGAISVTCYPGHEEGAKEEAAIIDLVMSWSPQEWSCCHHRWVNRKASPSLLLLQRADG